MSVVPIVYTDRLLLRPFEDADAEDVFEPCRNPKLGLDAGWPPHQSIDDSYVFIREIAPLGFVWAITERPAGAQADGAQPVSTQPASNQASSERTRVIGSIGLLPDPSRPDEEGILLLGYWLHEDFWNRGYTTEASKAVLQWACENCSPRLFTTSHYFDNDASRRVIEKCGFSFVRKGLWEDDDSLTPDRETWWYEMRPEDFPVK